MEDRIKIKIAKEVAFNVKLLGLALILWVVIYLVFALYYGGFKAKYLYDNMINITIKNDLLDEEAMTNYSRTATELGVRNNTIVTETYFSDSIYYSGYNRPPGEALKKFEKEYLINGTIYEIGWDSNMQKTRVTICANNATLSKTIDHVFGIDGILRSLDISLIVLLVFIMARYAFRVVKWVRKYSSHSQV